MAAISAFSDRGELAMRWLARAAALLSLTVLTLFLAGATQAGNQAPGGLELIGLAFFPVAVMLGLLIGLVHPTVGGIVALGGTICFYIWHWLAAGELPSGPFFWLFTSPALLYVLSGWMLNHRSGLTP